MAVTSDALAPILPSGIARMDWNESGPTTGLSVSGRFDANRLKLGGIDLGQSVTLSLLPAALSGDLLIPVKVDIPAATGSISFLNGDQTVAIQGRLEKLSIDGRIIIPLTDIDSSRLEIAPEKFQVVVGAAISISPVVAGVKPNFLDSKLAVLNDTEVRIGKNNKSGTAILTATTLLLAQPVIKIGDNGTQNPATIDLKSEGMARIRYDLDSSKSVLVQAKLSATNITFNLLGPEPKVLDLGGDQISNPTVSLKRISIEIDQLSAVKVERAELEKLSINASRLTKTLPAGATEGMTYSGALTRPFTLDMARAGRVSVGDAIVLGGFELNLLDLSIGDASVNLGGGINVAHGTLTLRTQQVREVELLGRRLQQVKGAQLTVEGKVAIHSPSMSINDAVDTRISLNLDGTEGSLNGAGSLKFGTFTGSARSQLVIKFDCRNTGQLNVEMETNLLVGGGDFQARMENGKFSADGATGPIAAAAHSLDPNTGCDNPSIKHVVQKQGEWWTDGICSKGLEFYHCRWESPEVSYSYHVHLAVRLLSATLLMTNPHVYLNSGGEVGVCNIGALVVTPLAILGGYSPGIDSPYPGLDNIVNGLIQIGFEPFQSAALTGIGAGAGWLVSSIATPAGNILCIGKPL